MKKILALVLAMLLVLGMVSALAVENEKTITLNGLEDGDAIKYYQVLEFDESAEKGWKFTDDFKTLTAGDLNEILTSGINDAMATKIAALAKTAIDGGSVDTAKSWSKSDLNPGLYMVQAVPSKAEVIYNPVFLAVQADGTGTTKALPLNYDGNGTAKKSDVTLLKETKSAGDSAWGKATTEDVGDIVDYKITTTVPAYLESYTNPMFKVTDTLTKGLTYKTNDTDNTTVTLNDGSDLTSPTDYSIEFKTNASGQETFEINFTKAYLQKHTAATVVTITYQAKITADAKNVNPETNTATIEYSRNPDDENDHGTKEDKTKHYTFDIDAGLQGDEEYTTSEIVKIGKDENGNILYEEKSYSNKTTHHPLAGAEFEIFTDAACTNHYTNSTITAETKFSTDDMGRMNIKGLDEGTYYLKETKAAPGGFMLLTDKLKFVISATYKDVAATETCNAYKELDTYSVVVSCIHADNTETAGATSTYTLDNGTVKKNNGVAGDNTTEVINTKGTSLPSTGGMGTTLLYVGGSILVLAAVILLVTKRRMNAED